VALLFATPVARLIRGELMRVGPNAALVSQSLLLAGLFYLSCLSLAAGAYNPFIYFRF